jgi:hypothetical protein
MRAMVANAMALSHVVPGMLTRTTPPRRGVKFRWIETIPGTTVPSTHVSW